ncbi:MAG: tRNA dihydrouridine synthase DusB [Firmicutes bacterium HGW-Firmicutes-1]|jgi:nifR3 family TIM-barrel protein|nr:MAG: tRNA dihydrouridine synthase DusB [Firmicutes bacterium HGW-Firmicutes-1]
MNIGKLELGNKVLLAPMAGVTDMPFRLLCKEQGCGLVYTEMVSAKAIMYRNPKCDLLLQTHKAEGPVGVQLFGSDPKILAEMAQKIDSDAVSVFDVNMGCPVPKVVNNGEGSALMRNPKLIGEIVKAISDRVEKPVTVKIRKGFDESSINAVEVAKIAEANGANAITIHGRTREQYYSGKADWDIIRQVKAAVAIPVIGNGDIFSPIDAKRMLEVTGCDGVMVARGAQGNPWIFKEILHYLETSELLERPSISEIVDTIMRHTKLLIDLKGEYIGVREMRKHISWYTKGMKNSSKIRQEINHVESFISLKNYIELLCV